RRRADRDRVAREAPPDQEVGGLHADPLVRDRDAALRRAADRAERELRPNPRYLVCEPARLPEGLPLRGLQRCSGESGRPARDRSHRRRRHRDPQRPLQDGGLMPTRVMGLTLRMAVLVLFGIFFVAPILWLVLAPTKSDHALVLSSPFTFG